MSKRYEEEQWRIEHANNATITFTIALHGPHAWKMRMEDSRRYHSISRGGPLRVRTLGKIPSRPYCVSFLTKRPTFRFKQYQTSLPERSRR